MRSEADGKDQTGPTGFPGTRQGKHGLENDVVRWKIK